MARKVTKFSEIEGKIKPYIKKLFSMVGVNPKNFDFSNEQWYYAVCWSENQENGYKDWIIKRLKKDYKYMTHEQAVKESAWVMLMWSWTTSEDVTKRFYEENPDFKVQYTLTRKILNWFKGI